jgi:hypothetical protein
MVRNKLTYYLLLFYTLVFQGCVHGDLDDCPPMVNYAVAFEYTDHTAGSVDRFYEEVKKVNVYVFDEDNLVYTTTTEIGPYENDFKIPLNLPMGKYRIITWGNLLDGQPFTVTPDAFVQGETTFAEARLILQDYADNLRLENLFYGERTVDIPLYYSKTDTIPLINNTNNVRVVLHWDHTGPAVDHSQAVDYNEVIVALTAKNVTYDFNNTALTTQKKSNPYYTDLSGDTLAREATRRDTRSWQRLYYYPDNIAEKQDSMVFDFRILRMTVDETITLSVMRKKPVMDKAENLFVPERIGDYSNPERFDDPENPVYGVDIVGSNADTEAQAKGYNKLFRSESDAVISDLLLEIPRQQRRFDINEYYRIDVYLKYVDLYDSYVSGEVQIHDWHKVEYNDGGGDN